MKEFSLAQNWWQLVLIAIACYLIGCFNFARAISRAKKQDITKMGSGNPGTMNMTREFGIKIGALTFICDILKGGAPALIAYFVYRGYSFSGTVVVVSDFMRYFCGVWVIVGHIFPITTKFKGGKGIASILGLYWVSLSCENLWWIGFGGLVIIGMIAFIYFVELGSLGSLLAVTAFSIAQGVIFVLRYSKTPLNAYTVCLYMLILALNVLAWGAHHANIKRLFAGEEHKTSLKKMVHKKKNK